MATVSRSTRGSVAAASDDKTKAQAGRGPTRLDQVETKVKVKAHAAAKDIAQRLHDFEKTNAKHVARAKRKIKADVAKVKKATAGLGDKLRAHKK